MITHIYITHKNALITIPENAQAPVPTYLPTYIHRKQSQTGTEDKLSRTFLFVQHLATINHWVIST